MVILNSYLTYPDDELANSHRHANKLGLLDLTASERIKLATEANVDQNIQDHIHETKVLKLQSNVHLHTCRLVAVADFPSRSQKYTHVKAT